MFLDQTQTLFLELKAIANNLSKVRNKRCIKINFYLVSQGFKAQLSYIVQKFFFTTL